MKPDWSTQHFDADGFVLLRGLFTADELGKLSEVLADALRAVGDASVRHKHGAVYAARNVLEMAPELERLALKPEIATFVRVILGEGAGLVRGLFFDKPPERTWALPWHKDLSIAASPRGSPSPRYSPVRMKAGVPHVEAPVEVLERMLTLRIHLDPATEANGPLEVWPGSHRTGKTLMLEKGPPVTILSSAGDVLAMRPLTAHCSGLSHAQAALHRRVLHLEFAADESLPDDYRWHRFTSLAKLPGMQLGLGLIK